MSIDEFIESIKYATKIIEILKKHLAEDMETSYVAFIYIVSAHALTLNDIETSNENILRLLEKINNTIGEEIKQMIAERN
jgi:hypothetical protein